MSSDRVFELIDQSFELGDTPEKVAILEEAVRIADSTNDEEGGFAARMELIDAAEFSGIFDLGAKDRCDHAGFFVNLNKIAQIGIEKTVTVHHQDRVGFDFGGNKAKRARGAEWFGLDHGDDVDAGE